MHPFFSSFEGLIPLFGGIYIVLIAYGYLPGKPKNPEKFAVWQKKYARMFRIAGPLLIIYGLILSISIPWDTLLKNEDIVTRTVREFNQDSNKMVDKITRFDRATGGPGKRITIDETAITLNSTDISEEAWQKFLPQLRKQLENSKVDMLTQEGVTVVYRYFGKDGVLIHEVIFEPTTR